MYNVSSGSNQGKFVDANDIDLSASYSAAATVTGNAIELDHRRIATAKLGPSVISTADTLDVKFQGSDDGTTWADITGAAFAQQTDASFALQTKTFVCPRYIRPVSVVAGSGIAITAPLKLEIV